MKTKSLRSQQHRNVPMKVAAANQRAYWTAIWIASLGCGASALAQTNPTNTTNTATTTNTPPAAATSPNSGSSTNVTKLEDVTVSARLDVSRNEIVPSLGATKSTLGIAQIQALPAGENARFDQLLLNMPGVAQDSLGQLHVRGEHANLQYRINDVLLPEGITGFGPELSARFVESVSLITGSLPAQYGFRTAGIVDIHTKSGAFDQGGDFTVYGGSYDTINPSFTYGGSQGNLNYWVIGSYNHNGIGIENPTSSATPVHDTTDQGKTFTYLSYNLDDTSRISTMLAASYSTFQIPNTPGLPVGMAPGGDPWNTGGTGLPTAFDSSDLNERQTEQNYYGVITYQKSVGDFNLLVSALGRNSMVHFMPDPVGDLFFNGVASDVNRGINSGGLQADMSYKINDAHTVRGGFSGLYEVASANNNTTVFPTIGGNPTGPAFTIPDQETLHGTFYGFYLQDEWKALPRFTINYGARFDVFSSYISENQISPRVNTIWEANDCTTLHAGYSRYFTPPPLELVRGGSVTQFTNTSNASAVTQDDPVKSERAHYFDLGITQKVLPGLQFGVDGYYKIAKDQLDDGFFGQTLILSPFNYRDGRVYGVEFTTSYTLGGFSTYANVAVERAQGRNVDSAQFLFGNQPTLDYIKNNWVFLDHDQRITGSFGASYRWQETKRSSTLFLVNAIYGSGLREDGNPVLSDGVLIPTPNGSSVGPYSSVGIGVEQDIKLNSKQYFKARLDVVNVSDNIYQLRTGTGIGVNAAQFGERRGFFGTLGFVF
jgi:TonB dependent receptor